eukprot:6403851-Prymnesium_polylepis.1
MPRNKAGGGRSGQKQLKRQVKYKAAKAAAAADTTTAMSTTSQDAAATKEDELEEQTAPDAVDEAGAQVTGGKERKALSFAYPVSNVHWST